MVLVPARHLIATRLPPLARYVRTADGLRGGFYMRHFTAQIAGYSSFGKPAYNVANVNHCGHNLA